MVSPGARGTPLPVDLVETKQQGFRARRTFGQEDLESLEQIIGLAGEPVTIAEAQPVDRFGPRRVVALRHDVDHDLETAVAFGRWEVEHGMRSTYFLLHTDWYYRADGGELTTELLQAADSLASMGHEIALHNNAITVALATGADPLTILDRELEQLRRHGFDVIGTVAHGDPLCRQLGYVNSEVFSECQRPLLGSPDRMIEGGPGGRDVYLRPVPMQELGLRYEAGYIGHGLYLSDTGGRWSQPLDEVTARIPTAGKMQILTHPVWWAFDDEPVRPRAPREGPIPAGRLNGGRQ